MTDKKERTVIHLEIDNRHYYFGSMSGLYEHFSSEILGIAYSTLRKYGLSENKPFVNDKCIIRKGKLIQKNR